jgi:hypothetical protein
MTLGRRFRILWLAGLALLAASQAMHAFEHWEIAAHADCLAHAHDHSDGDHGDDEPRHDHGCASHDHAPALVGGIFVLPFTETVSVVSPVHPAAPGSRGASIDHPPQLS